MAVYDLEEQEQIDELKTWWKRYGNLVTGGALAITLSVAAWQGWNWWQRSQATQASVLYSVVEQASRSHDAKKAREATGELIDKFPGTSYAGMAALLSARVQAESSDLKTARAQLQWAADHASDEGLRDLAHLRLASMLLDAKELDDAMKAVSVEPSLPFAARFAEIRGDILSAQGKSSEAKAAYQTALNKYDEMQKAAGHAQRQAPYRDMLQVKMEFQGIPLPSFSNPATNDAAKDTQQDAKQNIKPEEKRP